MIDHALPLIESSIRGLASKTAIRVGTREISYADYGELADVACVRLQEAGVRQGDRVGLLFGNSPDYLFADLALLRLGAVEVPINSMLSDADIAYIMRHSGAVCLVTLDDVLAARLDGIRSADPGSSWHTVSFGEGLELAADAPGESAAECRRHTPSAPSDDAVIFYTGGTTGRPKGVVHTNASVASNWIAHIIEGEIRRDDVLQLSSPLPHSAGRFAAAAFIRGATVELCPKFSVDALVSGVLERGVTWAFLVPTMIYQLLDTIAGTGEELAGLQTIVYGASPIAPARLRQALSATRAGFIQLYGQTECPNWGTTLSKLDHHRALNEPDLLDSCGAAGALTEVRVVNDSGVARIDEVGEVELRSPYLMRGYLDDPAATEAVMVDGWLRTGDLGVLDTNGYLHLKDRAKDMIISGGMNVYSSEVESVLQRFAGVSQAAVIGIPHATWGEAVTAFVVAKPGERIDLDALALHARAELATYKRPKSIELINALPLTPLGKPDKKALRAPYWSDSGRQIT